MTTIKKTYRKPESHIISLDDPKYAEIMSALAEELHLHEKTEQNLVFHGEALYPPQGKC